MKKRIVLGLVLIGSVSLFAKRFAFTTANASSQEDCQKKCGSGYTGVYDKNYNNRCRCYK